MAESPRKRRASSKRSAPKAPAQLGDLAEGVVALGGGFGFHPMFCFLDATGEALAGILRPGNAVANSGADQLAVVDGAIAHLPAQWQAGHHPGEPAEAVAHPVLVRADTAGAVRGFIQGLMERNCEFSVSGPVSSPLDTAIAAVADTAWVPARDANGTLRRGAQVVELDVTLEGWPPGTRAICRREKPHPGAQLRLWDHDGWRHQVVLTNSEGGLVDLELRHRRHAEVENRIRNLKDCGLERMPFSALAANAAWLELVLTAADLLAWCQRICLDGDLARAEPRTLRYRLLHAAGRLVHRSRQVLLRLPEHWPWAKDLAVSCRLSAAGPAQHLKPGSPDTEQRHDLSFSGSRPQWRSLREGADSPSMPSTGLSGSPKRRRDIHSTVDKTTERSFNDLLQDRG